MMFKEGWENNKHWFYTSLVLLLIIVYIGTSIRTTNISQLKDVTTGEYTLGPDLDPFLYLRLAHDIINTGVNPNPDYTRYLGLGPPYRDLISYDIVYLYKFLSFFSGKVSVEYAAIILPVIAFGISTIFFFFFVREVFIRRNEFEKNLIAVLATALYVVIPAMQHRTTAGIPELESAGMVFFWLAFLFFLKSWNSNGKTLGIDKKYLFAFISGLATALMIFTWGGFRFILFSLSLATLIMFFLGKVKKQETIAYLIWFVISDIAIALYLGLSTAVFDITTSASAIFVAVILLGSLLFEEKIGKITRHLTKKEWISNQVSTFFLISIIGFTAVLIIKPAFALGIFGEVVNRLLYPYGSQRTGLTVAENMQPYLTDLFGNFGKGFFWMMIFGTIFLFYEMVKDSEKRKKYILFGSFLIFITGFTFSRYSPNSIFNGTNLISQIFIFGGVLIFLGSLIYVYVMDSKSKKEFGNVEYSYLFLFILTILMILASKGAIRLLFISSPVFTIPVAFLVVELFSYWKRSTDEFWKFFFIILLLVSAFFFITTFTAYYKTTSSMVTNGEIPSGYTIQWQKAMAWVRENTPQDSRFVHWWDYGYWIQTIGKRPTVTDGGHLIGYWDHLTGRYLLTTPKPETAFSLMKSYNVSYLLIDSTDLGKYGAYSSIGSNKAGLDRVSQIPIMLSRNTQQNANGTVRIYQGGSFVDEDIIYGKNNPTLLPMGKAAIVGIILQTVGNNSEAFMQPQGAFVYNQQQINIPIRYLYYRDKMVDFEAGLDAVVKIIPEVTQNGNQINIDFVGAVIYLSPKVSKSLFGQLYLLDDAFGNYKTVKLAHSEDDDAVMSMNAQGANVGDLIYFNGLRGSIKIWKVDYPPNINFRPEFLKTSGEYAELDNLSFTT